MLLAMSAVVTDSVVATPVGVSSACDAAFFSTHGTQAAVSTSHAGMQSDLQSFESMGCQTDEDFPATSSVLGDFVVAMPVGGSCSRETQATVSTSHAGMQCNLQSFQSMGCQTNEAFDFPGSALDTAQPDACSKGRRTYLVLQQQAVARVLAQRGVSNYVRSSGVTAPRSQTKASKTTPKPLVGTKPGFLPLQRPTNNHQETWIDAADPYDDQSCKPRHDRRTYSKSLSCQFCSKPYTNWDALLAHEKAHPVKKPFVCNACHRCFTSQMCLEIHERQHTLWRLFSCHFCNKSFSCASSLGLHERIHETNSLFICYLCHSRCRTKGGLAAHYSRVHASK